MFLKQLFYIIANRIALYVIFSKPRIFRGFLLTQSSLSRHFSASLADCTWCYNPPTLFWPAVYQIHSTSLIYTFYILSSFLFLAICSHTPSIMLHRMKLALAAILLMASVVSGARSPKITDKVCFLFEANHTKGPSVLLYLVMHTIY